MSGRLEVSRLAHLSTGDLRISKRCSTKGEFCAVTTAAKLTPSEADLPAVVKSGRRHIGHRRHALLRARATMAACAAVVGAAMSNCATEVSAQTAAQVWPNRPLTWVVPYAAGGVTDMNSRRIADLLKAKLGQTVIVENRPGAGGIVGTDFVSRAAPDGYTVLYASSGPMTIQPNMPQARLGYDPLKSFVPVRGVSAANQIIVATARAPYDNLKQLVAYAKSHPRQVNFGSPGVGTAQHLAGEMFQSATGTVMTHVPYKSGSSQMVDMMSGIMDVSFDYLPVLKPLIESGQIKVLGTTGTERMAALPDAPTVLESGYPDAVNVGASWVSVPAGTSRDIVEKLSEALAVVLADPLIEADQSANGQTSIADKTTAALEILIADETARYGRIIQKSGIGSR